MLGSSITSKQYLNSDLAVVIYEVILTEDSRVNIAKILERNVTSLFNSISQNYTFEFSEYRTSVSIEFVESFIESLLISEECYKSSLFRDITGRPDLVLFLDEKFKNLGNSFLKELNAKSLYHYKEVRFIDSTVEGKLEYIKKSIEAEMNRLRDKFVKYCYEANELDYFTRLLYSDFAIDKMIDGISEVLGIHKSKISRQDLNEFLPMLRQYLSVKGITNYNIATHGLRSYLKSAVVSTATVRKADLYRIIVNRESIYESKESKGDHDDRETSLVETLGVSEQKYENIRTVQYPKFTEDIITMRTFAEKYIGVSSNSIEAKKFGKSGKLVSYDIFTFMKDYIVQNYLGYHNLTKSKLGSRSWYSFGTQFHKDNFIWSNVTLLAGTSRNFKLSRVLTTFNRLIRSYNSSGSVFTDVLQFKEEELQQDVGNGQETNARRLYKVEDEHSDDYVKNVLYNDGVILDILNTMQALVRFVEYLEVVGISPLDIPSELILNPIYTSTTRTFNDFIEGYRELHDISVEGFIGEQEDKESFGLCNNTDTKETIMKAINNASRNLNKQKKALESIGSYKLSSFFDSINSKEEFNLVKQKICRGSYSTVLHKQDKMAFVDVIGTLLMLQLNKPYGVEVPIFAETGRGSVDKLTNILTASKLQEQNVFELPLFETSKKGRDIVYNDEVTEGDTTSGNFFDNTNLAQVRLPITGLNTENRLTHIDFNNHSAFVQVVQNLTLSNRQIWTYSVDIARWNLAYNSDQIFKDRINLQTEDDLSYMPNSVYTAENLLVLLGSLINIVDFCFNTLLSGNQLTEAENNFIMEYEPYFPYVNMFRNAYNYLYFIYDKFNINIMNNVHSLVFYTLSYARLRGDLYEGVYNFFDKYHANTLNFNTVEILRQDFYLNGYDYVGQGYSIINTYLGYNLKVRETRDRSRAFSLSSLVCLDALDKNRLIFHNNYALLALGNAEDNLNVGYPASTATDFGTLKRSIIEDKLINCDIDNYEKDTSHKITPTTFGDSYIGSKQISYNNDTQLTVSQFFAMIKDYMDKSTDGINTSRFKSSLKVTRCYQYLTEYLSKRSSNDLLSKYDIEQNKIRNNVRTEDNKTLTLPDNNGIFLLNEDVPYTREKTDGRNRYMYFFGITKNYRMSLINDRPIKGSIEELNFEEI